MYYIKSENFNSENIVIENDKIKKSIIYLKYKFPDGKIRNLNILSSFLRIKIKNKKFFADINNEKCIELKNVLELIDNKIETIIPNYKKNEDDNKINGELKLSLINSENFKTEIIEYNNSMKNYYKIYRDCRFIFIPNIRILHGKYKLCLNIIKMEVKFPHIKINSIIDEKSIIVRDKKENDNLTITI